MEFRNPSSLKAWIDHVVRVRRTFSITAEGYVGTLRDRPVFVAVSSGGRYSGERARQPDFLTPYVRAVLSTIGINDLHILTLEGVTRGADIAEAVRRALEIKVRAGATGGQISQDELLAQAMSVARPW